MSADPLIQAAYNSQSYNRYSYVLNNPLSFTDPTGFSWWTKWRRPIIAIVAAIILQPLIAEEVMWALAPTSANALAIGNAVGSAAAGFAAGGIMGGNLESAMQGAVSALAFFAVGEFIPGGNGSLSKIAGHALAGCASSALAGGSCGQGAASAGFAEFAGPFLHTDNFALNVVAQAAVGAVASRLAGGSYQSGAITAAFGYLFNCSIHPGTCTADDADKIKQKAAQCTTPKCRTEVVNDWAEARLFDTPTMLEKLVSFEKWSTFPVLVFTPEGRALDLTWDSAVLFWDTVHADWADAIPKAAGIGYALWMEHVFHLFGLENAAGIIGALSGKAFEIPVDNLTHGR
jgi:hypothetical protein